jgi:hypothetical protein
MDPKIAPIAESGAHVVDEFAVAGQCRISCMHWADAPEPRQRTEALPTERDCLQMLRQ